MFIETATKAIFYNPNFITIQWDYQPANTNNLFEIYYSENPQKNFRLLATLPGDRNHYMSHEINLHSEARTIYFFIRCVKPDGSSEDSKIFSNTGDREIRYAAHVMERLALELKRLNGIATLYFQKRTIGEHCPECWDPVARRSTNSRCLTCYGTGIKGGYYDPILIYVNYTPMVKHHSKATVGTIDTISAQAWTLAFPIITPESIFIELNSNANRWRVKQIQFSELHRIPIRQRLQLEQIPRDAIEWKLPAKSIEECEEHNIWKEIL